MFFAQTLFRTDPSIDSLDTPTNRRIGQTKEGSNFSIRKPSGFPKEIYQQVPLIFFIGTDPLSITGAFNIKV